MKDTQVKRAVHWGGGGRIFKTWSTASWAPARVKPFVCLFVLYICVFGIFCTWLCFRWVPPGATASQPSSWMTSLGLEDDSEEDPATAAKRKVKLEQDRMRKRAKLLADGSWMDNNDLLPPGWMMKGELGSPTGRIISPDGFTAPSLRLHLKRILQQGSSDETSEVGFPLSNIFPPKYIN